MKKMKVVIFVLLAFILGTPFVQAACSAEEKNKLNSMAANVKVSYEEKVGIYEPGTYSPPEGMTDEEIENYQATYTYFQILIQNLTEELYVTVYNDATDETKTYTYENSDNGVIKIDWLNIRSIANLTVTVYSSKKTNCPETKLYVLTKTLPRYNEYSSYGVCQDIKEFYLCHEYLAVDTNTDFDAFDHLVKEYKAGKLDKDGEQKPQETEKEKKKGIKDFIKENKAVIIASIVVVIAGGVTIVVIIKKKRSKIQ